MPINDLIRTMETKLYDNLMNLTKHLDKINLIENDFQIIERNQYDINNEMKSMMKKQEEIMKFMINYHNREYIKETKAKNNKKKSQMNIPMIQINSSLVKDFNSQDKKRYMLNKANKGSNFLGLQSRSITGKGLSIQKNKKMNSVLSEVDETKRSFKSDENSHRGMKKTFIKQTGIPTYLNCSSRKKKIKFSLKYKAKSIIMSPQTRPRDINQLKKQGTFTIQLFSGIDDIQH